MNFDEILVIGSHIEIKPFDKETFLLVNNNSEKYLRINKNFNDIINLIDGKKRVKDVITEFNKSASKPITEEAGISIFRKLNDIGLFSEVPYTKKKLPDYISLGFIFFPKKWVGNIVPYLKFLFNKKVIFFSLIFCIIFLIYLSVKSFSNNQRFNFLQILPFYFLISFISTIFHELGHATAAHYYKSKHGGIGFGFYFYFMPVFFADVTDIWKLNKWKRIVVNVAGVYFEVLFCGVLAVLSFIFHNNDLLAIVSFLSLRTLYNLLPYFRTDGYWILSDYVNQPNLLQTSFIKAKQLALLKFKIFKIKDFFLAFYGIFNFGLMIYFIGFMLFFYFSEIISFPKKIFLFVINIKEESFIWSLKEVSLLFPVLLFYLIIIRFLMSFNKSK